MSIVSRSEPCRHTCPDIDRIIDNIKDIIKQMDSCSEEDFKSDLIENINSWRHDLSCIAVGYRCDLENLRDANDSLRRWGNDLVIELEALETEIAMQ